MPIDLQINQGSIIKLPHGVFRFHEERPNKILLLRREGTGFEIQMPEHKLEKLLGEGKAELIDFMASGPDEVKGPNDSAEFGPDEEWSEDESGTGKSTEPGQRKLSPEVRRARALQFYARKWDEAGRATFGLAGLQKLIDAWRPVAIQKGYELKDEPDDDVKVYRVRPAQLRRMIRKCGQPDERPVRLFRSRRGKSPREHFEPFVEDALDASVDFYWKERGRSYGDAYAFFRALIRPENVKRKTEGLGPLRFPKRMETLRRRITAATNYVNWSRKYTPYEAHRKFKGTKGHLSAEKPLELVIMDHTRVDLWVLDTDTGLPLGKPWLTTAIDVATRMILGYLISFEPASLYSVLTTLKRVNKNKAYIKSEFPDIGGVWNAWGRPGTILVDRGWEFTSPSFQDALQDLGTDIIWAPVLTPQYKAIGERFFGTLNTKLFHKLPGGVPYPVSTMRQVRLDPKSEAVITLGDIDEIMHQAIIAYHNEKHTGLGGIPARVWRDKIRQHRRPFIKDIKALNALLGRVHNATLFRDGITFKNMQFHDPALTGDLLEDLVKYEAKRSQSDKTYGSGRVKVKIKWDPIDASSIEVWNPGGFPGPHYVTLKNTDQKFFKNLSFWHWDRIREYAEERDLDFMDEDARWKARDDLSKKWRAITVAMPMRETRQARRGLARSQGTFDGKDTNDDDVIGPNDILHAVAESSRDGMAEATLVPDEIAAAVRQDEGERKKGRTPSKFTVAKTKRTKQRNDAAAEEQAASALQRKRAREASGESVLKKAPSTNNVFDDDLGFED